MPHDVSIDEQQPSTSTQVLEDDVPQVMYVEENPYYYSKRDEALVAEPIVNGDSRYYYSLQRRRGYEI